MTSHISNSNPVLRIITHYIPLFREDLDTGVLSSTRNIPMRLATHFPPPPPASMMINTKKHSGKKIYIPSDCPRNNADRDALKYANTPSMYSYILTIGPSPSTSDTALAPATAVAASRASSVNVKMSSKTHGLYNKHDDKSG